MKIKITADSTCDLSPELVEKYNITIVPLYIVKGEESLKDGVEITPEDIFKYVDSGKGVCSTAAVNLSDYIEVFSEQLKSYDAVILDTATIVDFVDIGPHTSTQAHMTRLSGGINLAPRQIESS